MKRTKAAIILGLALLGAQLLPLLTKAGAQPPKSQRCEVVWLSGIATSARDTNGMNRATGVVLYNASSSIGAPKFRTILWGNGTQQNDSADEMTEAMARLYSEGYHLEHADANGVFMVKKP